MFMFFIVNMVFCDFFMGVYFVIIGDLNIFNMFLDIIVNLGKKFVFEWEGICKFLIVIFMFV